MVLAGMMAKAQSPSMTIDSLERYINRYIRNSAVEAFTNLRMNTVLINLARYADSAIGAGTLDTAYRAGDSLKIVTNLKTFTVYIGGTGGNQNLSVTTTSTTVNVNIDGTGTDATLPAATTSQAGVMTGAMKSKLDSSATHRLWANDSIIIYYNSLGIEKWRDTLKALVALNSLEASGNAIQLDGDQASPGNNKVYGTDGSGVKGWKADPVGGSSGAIRDSLQVFYGGKTNGRMGGGVARGTLSGGGTGNAVETVSWAELLTGNHTSLYIDSVRVDATTNEIVIYYAAVANLISIIPVTDDNFGDVGIFASGPGVSTTQARFKMKRLVPAYMILTGNGSSWVTSGEYNPDYTISYNSTSGLFTLSTSGIGSQIFTDVGSQGMIRGWSWSDTTTAYYNVRKFPGTASRGFYEEKFDLRDGTMNTFTGAPATTNEFIITLPHYWRDVELRTFDSRTSQQNRNFWSQTNVWFILQFQK
jgi:hypothetical protein